ncbi:MAG: hypothetical protein V1743_07000 [Nanoarchaeota archaeon]
MLFQKKAKVILDTNFLLIPGMFKIDIFTEINSMVNVPHEIWIVAQTSAELEKIITGKGKKDEILAAKLALVFIKQQSLKIARSSKRESADDAILDLARKDDFVATQDKELKKKLNSKGVKIIVLRQKTHLSIEN